MLCGQEYDEVLPRGVVVEQMRIAAIPPYVPNVRQDGRIEVLSSQEVMRELQQITGIPFRTRGHEPLPSPPPRIIFRFEEYSVLHHAWFTKFIFWFRQEMNFLGLNYRHESWDCDDFSMALHAFADLAQLSAKVHSAPHLIGRLIVDQRHAWAGTPAGFTHEIVVFRSSDSWWVCEPQNGQIGPLSTYPNRGLIREIIFN